MSKEPNKAGPEKTSQSGSGVPRAAIIVVAVAAALALLVYNFYTPAPTPTPPTETTSATGTSTTDTGASGTSSSDPTTSGATTAASGTPATPPTPDVAIDELMKPGPLPDVVLGNPDAPVTIVEYASMTCPHCAHFHAEVLPEVKTKYIDTGKAKLIFREFPLDNLAVGVSMLARCVEPSKFNAFISTMFKSQRDWAVGEGSPLPKLLEISKQAGFTEDSFNKCLENQKLQEDIVAVRTRADENFGITGTPTFFINGVKLKDGFGIEEFDKVMNAFGQG
ncbi:MAG: DsbA family protein [Hyphomicrobiaceae bacterium]